MSRSVFIASPEGSTGKSIVAFGLLDLLTRHVGKVPKGHDETNLSPARVLQRLHDELQRAVEREDFESAAEIRDRIKGEERRQATAAGGTSEA